MSEDINLNEAKGALNEYFNKKMKTFFFNEQRKISFEKQKLDYIINRRPY